MADQNARLAARGAESLPFTHDEVERSISERFTRVAELCPSALSIASGAQRVTYAELAWRSDRLAAAIALRASGSEAPVAVRLNDQVSMITGMLATWKAGKLCIPLDFALPQARLEVILRDSEAGLIVTDRDSCATLPPLPGIADRQLRIDEIDPQESGELPRVTVTADTAACLLYTSGSTGKPKGVVRTHRCVLHRARCSVSSLAIRPADRISALHSPAFAGGLRDVLTALLGGAALLPFDIRRAGFGALANWIDREQISVLCGVATTLRQFFASRGAQHRFPSIRIVRLGGEPLYSHDVEDLRKSLRRDCILVAGYGASEASGIVEYRMDPDKPLPAGRIPAGYPLEGVEIILLDKDGHPAGDGQAGEVCVRSRYLSSGYWRQPELTRAAFASDSADPQLRTYRTGDIGRLQSDGCLQILGRRDHQVKVRGYLVHPGEVELALVEYPAIREAIVTAFASPDGETRLAAYVVPRASTAPRPFQLRRYLWSRLPAYMVPAAFVSLDALPVNTNGKVDREGLPPPPGPSAGREAIFVAPRSPTEHQIAAIWEELFGVSPIGARDNFFDLGGDSLLAAEFVAMAEQTCGSVLSPLVLLEAPTVADLAIAMTRAESGFKELLTTLRASGQRAPIFFLHNDAGRGLYTHALARCLDPDHPFHAVHLHGLDELASPVTAEAIAANRIQAMRAVQRHGPYVLGGHCNGGLIALEMARQLHEAGEHVDLVVMVDTRAPSRGFRTLRRVSNVLNPLHRRFDRVWERIDWSIRYYQGLLRILARASARTQMDYIGHKLLALARPFTSVQDGPPARNGRSLDQLVRRDFTESSRVLRRAVRHYVPPRYAGSVVLFRAEQLPAFQPDLGWARLLPRFDVFVIPGDHHTCITRHVATFGARLNEVLRSTETVAQFIVSESSGTKDKLRSEPPAQRPSHYHDQA
jgi:amino acid adenylation domain-containing protein